MAPFRPSYPGVSRRLLAAVILTAAAAFLSAAPARALDPVFSDGGLAIRGFDPVAYHTEGKPVRGSSDFTHSYKGAVWRFTSAANRDAFAAEPARYAPQYGGYCAWAVAQGYTAAIDPDAWHIEDGRLYLNYSRSVQRRWAADIPGHISKADGNWPDLKAGN
jgi:YHS domain-containing protein